MKSTLAGRRGGGSELRGSDPSFERATLVDRVVGLLSPSAALRRGIRLIGEARPARAFALFARGARAGIVEAEYRVGKCYFEGLGVPRNRAEAGRWLERAARQGHVDAQSHLARLCLQGGGIASREDIAGGCAAASLFWANAAGKPDFVMAEQWSHRAAEAGSAEAQAVLAFILASGPESMRNLDEARHWYERSAEAGCPQGALGYALALAPLTKNEEDRRRVAGWIRLAAEAGLPTAAYLLGTFMQRGTGVERNLAEAAIWFRRAATAGHTGAARALAEGCDRGRGAGMDPVERRKWIVRAAAAGILEAEVALAEMMVKGIGGPRDLVTAVTLYAEAAAKGHPGARERLWTLCGLEGNGMAERAGACASMEASGACCDTQACSTEILRRKES
jgi:uncharacterized protein